MKRKQICNRFVVVCAVLLNGIIALILAFCFSGTCYGEWFKAVATLCICFGFGFFLRRLQEQYTKGLKIWEK